MVGYNSDDVGEMKNSVANKMSKVCFDFINYLRLYY